MTIEHFDDTVAHFNAVNEGAGTHSSFESTKPGWLECGAKVPASSEKSGYKTKQLLFDYKMPPVKINMERERPRLPNN